jgi:hypothetical protein
MPSLPITATSRLLLLEERGHNVSGQTNATGMPKSIASSFGWKENTTESNYVSKRRRHDMGRLIAFEALRHRSRYCVGHHHKFRAEYARARRYLTDALESFGRLGALVGPEKVRTEFAELPK